MADKYKNKFDKMANEPVKKLVFSLAIPTIITMLVSAVYNMADSFFVGRIDTTSVASIGIVFSIMTLLQAIGFFLGNGSGILVSTYLGKKEKEKAAQYANVAFFTAVCAGLILAATGIFFSTKIAYMLGATQSTVAPASSYLKYILLGSPFILGSFVLNNQLRYQGSAIYSMFGILSGSLINIALDPLFIFKFNLGVSGAAIATVISQAIGFTLLIIGTFRGENIRISIKKFKLSADIYKDIFKNGLPSLSRQGIQTVATICLNFASAPYGDAVVAGMSVFNRVAFLGLATVIGFGQGFQPVCSFNNGAKKYDRVLEGYRFTIVVTTCFITALSVIGFIFAPQLISLFRDDAQVIEIGAKALRYQCLAYPLIGFCTASNMMMQSLRISGKATILALARQGIFYVPLMLILPRLLGVTGITITQPLADVFSFILTLFLAIPQYKTIKSKIGNKS
ncbi:MAG: MATE family efflux transporter [Eubacterium sp.]